jgi:Sulfotransferase family
MGQNVKAGQSRRGAQINVADLLSRARSATGLSDFGDRWFLDPLDQLVQLINREAGLVSNDEPPVRGMIGCLMDRLKLVDYVKRHPQVRDENLAVAGVIIGLPRGGSTLLQRLLSTSPQLTSTTCWELRFPVPEPDEVRGDPARRVAAGRAAIDAIYAAWPEMKSMHPMDAMGFDEEILLIDRTFLSLNYSHYFNIPSYDGWQLRQDHGKAYEELRLWLQVLQFNSPDRLGKKWLLKSPHHLLGAGLKAMLASFPDAKVIMTHRAIENVIASYCSIQSLTVSNYSNNFDQRRSGANVVRMFTEALEILIGVRRKEPADRFIDVQYRNLLDDPMGQFRRTMNLMNLVVHRNDEAAAQSWMAQNGRDSHPRHRYAAQDYGITDDQLIDAFGFYAKAFLDRPAEPSKPTSVVRREDR